MQYYFIPLRNIFFLDITENSRKTQVHSTSSIAFQKCFKHIKNSSTIETIQGIQVPLATLLMVNGQTGNKYFMKWL